MPYPQLPDGLTAPHAAVGSHAATTLLLHAATQASLEGAEVKSRKSHAGIHASPESADVKLGNTSVKTQQRSSPALCRP